MPESPLVQKEVSTLNELEVLVAARFKGETETELTFRKRMEREAQEFRVADKQLGDQYRTESDALEAEYRQVRSATVERFKREIQGVEAEYAQAKQKAEAQAQTDRRRAKKASEETRWQALAMYEAGRDNTVKSRKVDEEALSATKSDILHLQELADPVLARCARLAGAESTQMLPAPDRDESAAQSPSVLTLQEIVKQADEELLSLEKLKLPVFLKLQNFVLPFVLLAVPVCFGLGTVLGWTPGAVVGILAVIALAVASHIGLTKLSRPVVARHYFPLRKLLAQAEELLDKTAGWIKSEFEHKQKLVEEKRTTEVKQADEAMARRTAEAEARYKETLKELDTKYPVRLAELARRRDEEVKKVDEQYPPRIQARKGKYERESNEMKEAYARTKAATQQLYDQAWAKVIGDWTDGMNRVSKTVGEVQQESARRFLDWQHSDLERWTPPAEVPPALPFGRFTIDLADFPNGVPVDPRLKSIGEQKFDLPALIPFPILSSVLIKTTESGKGDAVSLLQALMLRFLTSVPPGKVRFTIFDPVGLGENFAAFMHLADYSELLVNSRIWTETQQLEQRLADLSAHMENVIQKYLRNEFETIEQYNTYAGEVAEPFRILVVANFPANFNETAARRLLSVISSGARCGVYALVMYDQKLALPGGCQLKELEANCVNVNWKEGKLQWRDPNFGRFPLALDAPPGPNTFTRLLHIVGEQAKNANRVEVPFDLIAPPASQYWQSDSRSGVSVPLGRAGATKLQPLALGKGTSQHVLIAGKTGSGKSTLLHALITNAALRYSPDDLELYLIDFKKGVEFKVYAANELPHAKVIAVESEREFGLSVLQRLDVELKRRGDLYREVGVQDVKGWRDACPDRPLPRILFIVDEFQEFFVEDDKIAQEVSLLLDRMVRQGRAFGIHVILGSQTLSGAYSLARSTLGQMAVRIALQCSEADAHLILSEDNSAARLLTRPGEAIYNDANGMVEGNNLFQVVWLNDDRREEYLQDILRLAREANRAPATPIVFEGNLPAIASRNPLLNQLLDAASWPPQPPRSDVAWLGDAIAIKDPTSVVFRPQSGSNLLIIGQNDEAALAMLQMAGLSIAAQHPPRPEGVKFYQLDGSPVDSPLAGQLAKLADWIPHPVKVVSMRELARVMGEIAEEVERRRSSEVEDVAPIYVMIYDIQRYRDLRKSDDDFGYSSSFGGEEKAASPSKNFANILKDGPAVGIHVMLWCDSVNNLNRTFDRSGLREFELRVLFQMSANDSSSLIDSPAAGKLGENRALFYSEEENSTEKFRPYGFPDDSWISEVSRKLKARPRSDLGTEAALTSVSSLQPEELALGATSAFERGGDGATSHDENGHSASGNEEPMPFGGEKEPTTESL